MCGAVGPICGWAWGENLPFRHLLQDQEALLNDFDALGMADELFLLDYCDGLFAELHIVKVARSVKVVEVVQGRVTAPVIEGVEASSTGD